MIATVPVFDQGAPLDEIEAIYRARLHDFHRVARAGLGDGEAARDAVQDGFVRAVKDRRGFRGTGDLDAWVWRCVVNAIRDAARTSARRRRLQPLETERTTELRGVDEAVRKAVQQLPERQRLALFLRYYADLDYGAIASALGIAAGTVAATLNAAHATLRNVLEEARDH